MLLWTLKWRYLFELVFSFSLAIHPGVELLDHMVVLFLVFWDNSLLFSTVAAPIYIPTKSIQEFSFLLILSNICYLWPFWWQPFWGVKWFLWFWFAFFLMISNVEHLFMCLVVINMSFLKKSIQIFCHF